MGPDGRRPTRMIWVHEASPGGAARAGASNNAPAGRHRAERVPGDGCSAQMGGKVIAGRRNVRPACRARSPAPQGPRPRAARRARGQAGTMWRAGKAWGGIVSASGYRTGLGGIVWRSGGYHGWLESAICSHWRSSNVVAARSSRHIDLWSDTASIEYPKICARCGT